MPQDTKKEIEDLLKILERKTDKNIETITDKQLLFLKKKQFVKKKRRSYSVYRQKRFHIFLKERKLRPGKNFIEGFILYYYFLDWAKGRKRSLTSTPMSYLRFTGLMALYFPKKWNRINTMFFGTNRNLRRTYLTPMKEAAIRRRYEKENKRKIAKRKDKIS